MAITKTDYIDKKEYWDFQRKIEYNREVIYFMADKFKHRVYNDFGMILLDEIDSKRPFSLVRFGDGELQCIVRTYKGNGGENGDGDPYLPKIMIPHEHEG